MLCYTSGQEVSASVGVTQVAGLLRPYLYEVDVVIAAVVEVQQSGDTVQAVGLGV